MIADCRAPHLNFHVLAKPQFYCLVTKIDASRAHSRRTPFPLQLTPLSLKLVCLLLVRRIQIVRRSYCYKTGTRVAQAVVSTALYEPRQCRHFGHLERVMFEVLFSRLFDERKTVTTLEFALCSKQKVLGLKLLWSAPHLLTEFSCRWGHILNWFRADERLHK